jgi:hypothetical protein
MTRTNTRSKGQKLQPKGQVLRYKAHESINMAVAMRCTQFTIPRALRAALHGKTRPDHLHTRAIFRGAR